MTFKENDKVVSPKFPGIELVVVDGDEFITRVKSKAVIGIRSVATSSLEISNLPPAQLFPRMEFSEIQRVAMNAAKTVAVWSQPDMEAFFAANPVSAPGLFANIFAEVVSMAHDLGVTEAAMVSSIRECMRAIASEKNDTVLYDAADKLGEY